MNLKLVQILLKLNNKHNNYLENNLSNYFSQGRLFDHRHCLEFMAYGDKEQTFVSAKFCFSILHSKCTALLG